MYIHCTIKFQEVEEIVRNNNFEYYQIDNSDEYVGLPGSKADPVYAREFSKKVDIFGFF